MLGESIHFKEVVHPVDNVRSIAYVQGMAKGFSFMVKQEYSNEVLFSVCEAVTCQFTIFYQ